MGHKAEEKGLTFTTGLESDLPDHLIGDPARLRQILINLAGNAIKFTEQGEIHIAVEPCHKSAAPSSREHTVVLRFVVRDTGIGIADDKMEQLFQQFSQADASINRRFGGTGLGLNISRGLAEMMGGEMGVKSEQGRGSAFWFTARLEIGEGRLLQADACASQPSVDFPRARVLLAEDNPTNQMVAQAMLRNLGIEAHAVGTGLDAVHALSAGHYDLLLMDVQVPEMDGCAGHERDQKQRKRKCRDPHHRLDRQCHGRGSPTLPGCRHG
jgi:hypothetical protein